VTTLVISPHLDDAALSLGGAIAAWARRDPVVIATVYTAGPPLADVPRSMRAFADYETRRAEDRAAARELGASTRWLDRIERAFRPPMLAGTRFFTTPEDRAGFATLADVTAAIAPLLSPAPARIALPFAIGNHVDHVETMIAATDAVLAAGLADRVVFYEDFYALSAPMRRAHWVAGIRRWKPWEAPLLRARRLGAILSGIAVARRGPPVESLLAPHWRDARWTLDRALLAPADEAIKLRAIEAYASQTRAFGGLAGIDRALRAYHAWWGGAEPTWRPAW
jgi:LmbE family N-acetylglucosaminyl deacetylase